MDYLLQARQISEEDARLILSKVPQPIHVDPAPAPPTGLVLAGSSLQLTTLPTPILNSNVQPVASPPALPPQPQLPLSPAATVSVAKRAVPAAPKKVQARALWDYNTDDDVRMRSDLATLRFDPVIATHNSPSLCIPSSPCPSLYSYAYTQYHLPAIAARPPGHPPTHKSPRF